MTTRKQKLYSVIEDLPEELSDKVINYIEYLKISYMTDISEEDFVVKNREELRKKLEEGIYDTENGNVCSLEDAISEVKEI